MNRNTKIRVITPAKNGWSQKVIKAEDLKSSFRAKVCYYREENDYTPRKNDLSVFNDTKKGIQIGQALEAMDTLQGSLKYIVREPDEFFFGSTGQFKRINEITAAQSGDWGTENMDTDEEVSNFNVVVMYLERAGLIDSEIDEPGDILGHVIDRDKETYGSSNIFRGEMPRQVVSNMLTDGDFVENGIDIEPEEIQEEIQEEFGKEQQGRTKSCVLPNLPEKIIEEAILLRNNHLSSIKIAKSSKAITTLERQFLRKAEKLLGPYLTLPLNSEWTGFGYNAPKLRWEYLHTDNESELTEAARLREILYMQLRQEIRSCKSEDELWGPINPDKRGTKESRDFKKGCFGRIREIELADKALATKWSIKDWTDKDGVLHISALNKTRKTFIREAREQGKDEETIRCLVWSYFDREQGWSKPKIVNDVIVVAPIKYKDSIWRQKRTRALKDLNMTRAQWQGWHQMVSIVRKKLWLNTHFEDKDSIEARNEILALIKEIETLGDLNRFEQIINYREPIINKKRYLVLTDNNGSIIERLEEVEGEKNSLFPTKDNNYRYITEERKTWKFKPSLTDRISINGENSLKKLIMGSRNKLNKLNYYFAKLEESLISEETTDLDEVSISCMRKERDINSYNPQEPNAPLGFIPCDTTIVSFPLFGEIDNGKGFLFVRCETCDHITWLCKPGDKPMTKEEAINATK